MEEGKFQRVKDSIMKHFKKLAPDRMKQVEDEIIKARILRERVMGVKSKKK